MLYFFWGEISEIVVARGEGNKLFQVNSKKKIIDIELRGEMFD